MAIESEPTVVTTALPEPAAEPAAPLRVPGLIWRNSILLLAAEAFIGTSQQMMPTLGAIMAVRLTGVMALAGIGSSAGGLTRVLASYPSGRLADRYGRKLLLIGGLLLTLAGALCLGSSMLLASFPVFAVAVLVFGIGNGASQQQRRLSAADMYPPQLRARGLGLVLTGSLIGAIGGPIVIAAASALARGHHLDQVTVSWFLLPLVLVPSLGLILLIRPDPREIAMAIERYYPGYRKAGGELGETFGGHVSLQAFLRYYPHLVAFVCMFVLNANMSMMMALAPMTMTADGMSLSAISVTVSIHVLGMYALSLPIGKLTDRIGRRRVLFVGLAVSTIGTMFSALTASYAPIVLGLFLVGLGWSCGNVATAALVADTTPAQIRGAAMGANSSLSAAASVAAPLLGGVLLQFFGPASLVALTFLIVAPTLVLTFRLRERAPGVFAHASAW